MLVHLAFCSDLHRGPPGHPANDATPGWAVRWAEVPDPKLKIGDMDELYQFSKAEIGELTGTDVAGNHDASGPCKIKELVIGNTIVLHGHSFDPWVIRWLGRPVCQALRVIECLWPDVDVKAGEWFRRTFGGGRYGEREYYVKKAVAYAKKRGATQIVFGHLHQRFEEWRDGVHVVCTGCCCNGRMDFVEVEVEVEHGGELAGLTAATE